MKDLKHIHYFRELLEEANNELVHQAVQDGRIPVGYTCYFIPEVLMNVGNAFSVRLRAPKTGSLDVSTYYMTNLVCEYSRAIVERGIEGGYNFLGAFIAAEACVEMHRASEHFELLNLVKNEKFFTTFIDAPFKTNANNIKHYVTQVKKKILEPLQTVYGIDISDDSLRKAVALHNELCEIITEIGEFRKGDAIKVTGTEFHILNLVSYTCPKDLIIDKLRETLEEIKERKPDPAGTYRARFVLAGSELDDYEFTELIEENGGLVVADRHCFGSMPGREPIVLEDGVDVLVSIMNHYVQTSQCPRYMSQDKVDGRKTYVQQLVKDYNADGVIYEQLKFCEYWGYERALASHILIKEKGIPTLTVDRPYHAKGSGQLRTRIQAFVESVEIKKIQRKQG